MGEQVDATWFERHFAAARAAATSGAPEVALDSLDQALALWRGPALGDLADHSSLRSEAVRLDELRLAACELRGEMLLAAGQHAVAAPELSGLTRTNPWREQLWALYMLALYRSGRQGEALGAFQEARGRLVDELGVEPGPTLRDLERRILAQDEALQWSPPPPSAPPASSLSSPAASERPDPALRAVPVHDLGGLGNDHRGALAGPPRAGDRPGTDGPGIDHPGTDGAGIDGPGLPGRAAARSAAAEAGPGGRPRHELPRPLTSFVGRVAERAAVAEALATSRLVTLCGSGGCGKTRLAVEVARTVGDRFPDGVWFVDLASMTDPSLVGQALAAPLAPGAEEGDLSRLCEGVGDRRALFVLDNCEHVLDEVAAAASELLAGCPSARLLATSQAELPVEAGVVRRVGALGLPPPSGGDPEVLLASDAVQLFVERARAAHDRFAPAGEALEVVAHICRRLDGIPLAIELAAALAHYLPLPEIAERLDRRFELLDSGSPRVGAPSRQQTLQAALDWSFGLLGQAEQGLFVRLGVFVGEFTLPAAEAVAGIGSDPLVVVRPLGNLVRGSMVACVRGSDGAVRYRLLETMRYYAGDLLAQLPGAGDVHRRHARHYAAFAVDAERHVHGAAASEALAAVVDELPNLRSAMAWAFESGDFETGLRLAGSLRWFFARMGLLDEPVRWLRLALGRDDLAEDLRLSALISATAVAFMRGEFSRTGALGEESLALARRVGDPHQLAIALVDRGCAAVYEGKLDRAEECFVEGDSLLRDLGDRWGRAVMLTFRAVGSRRVGDMGLSRRQATEALGIFRQLGDSHGQALSLVDLALVDEAEGCPADGAPAAAEAAWLAVDLGDRQLQHTALCVLGRIEQALGRPREARELLIRSIQLFRGAHHQVMVALAFEGLAGLAADQGRHGDAAALLGLAAAQRDRLHMPASPRRSREVEALAAAAREALGHDDFAAQAARGAALGLDEGALLATAATAELATGTPLADLIAARR